MVVGLKSHQFTLNSRSSLNACHERNDMKIKIPSIFMVLLLSVISVGASADWRSGKVQQVSVGYDGQTIALKLEGWSRSNCSCYSSWPDHMCLDKARATHDFEKALLLSARARNTVVNVNIDEASCKVIAIYENN